MRKPNEPESGKALSLSRITGLINPDFLFVKFSKQ